MISFTRRPIVMLFATYDPISCVVSCSAGVAVGTPSVAMLPTKNTLLSQFDLTHRYHSQGLAAGGSALLDAINKGKVHLAKFILDAGEYNIVNTKDFKGKTPLIRACYIKVSLHWFYSVSSWDIMW